MLGIVQVRSKTPQFEVFIEPNSYVEREMSKSGVIV
jgi:hypothetical protein